jgi:GNAT superfamily N-acetyltransferase
VRRATEDDVAELVRLRRLMFEAMGLGTRDDRWQRAAAEVIGRDLGAGRLVAAVVDAPDGSRALAASGIAQFAAHIPGPTTPASTRAYLSSMSTDPRWRRRGYGTRVLDLLMDLCRARGAGVVELHATDAGRVLYERVGFVPRPGAPEMRWVDPTVAPSARQRRRAGPANTPSGS